MGVVRWRGVGGTLLALTVVAACSSFGGDDDPEGVTPLVPPGEDGGGADTSVGGEALAEVELAIASDLALVHDQPLSVDVTIKRKPPFEGRLTLSPKNLPTGLGIELVDVAPGQTTAKITLSVPRAVVQGTLKNVSLEARVGTKVVGSAPITGFVRGASGELDTTFGTDGFISIPGGYDSNALAMRADGSFYVMEALGSNTVRRFTKDGVLDKAFAANGAYVPGKPLSAMAWRAQSLFLAGSNVTASYVRKLDEDGALQTSYGTGGEYSEPTSQTQSVGAAAIGPAGELVFTGGVSFGSIFGYAAFLTSTGILAPDPTDTLDKGYYTGGDSAFQAILHQDTRVVLVGGRNVHRVIALTHNADFSFGNQGRLVMVAPTTALNEVLSDVNGKYVVGGIETDTRALVVARVTSAGALDASFGDGSGVFHPNVITAASGGKLALSGDKILQVATYSVAQNEYLCAVMRYTKDGVFDTTFGLNGRSNLPMKECYVGEVAVQPDGRIVVSGSKPFRIWP